MPIASCSPPAAGRPASKSRVRRRFRCGRSADSCSSSRPNPALVVTSSGTPPAISSPGRMAPCWLAPPSRTWASTKARRRTRFEDCGTWRRRSCHLLNGVELDRKERRVDVNAGYGLHVQAEEQERFNGRLGQEPVPRKLEEIDPFPQVLTCHRCDRAVAEPVAGTAELAL